MASEVTLPTTTQAHRRNRAALRDYYNLKSKGPGSAVTQSQNLSRTVSIASNASDSTTATTVTSFVPTAAAWALTAKLDEPNFDAENYISELLKNAGLRDILCMENALVSEIRTLDGERKALVYDNYSKLIKAVGTLGEMQRELVGGSGKSDLDEVMEVEGKLEGLNAGVKALGLGVPVASGEGGLSLRQKRRQRDVAKWVLAAPSRLGEMDNAEAEKEWRIIRSLLDRWEGKGVKGVKEVRTACEEVMARSLKNEDAVDHHKTG